MGTTCIFCGGACGRVCRGLGFKSSDGDRPKAVKPSVGPIGGAMPVMATGPSGANPIAKEPKAKVTSIQSGGGIQGSSRHVAGRTATTTSENRDVTAGETAPNSKRGRPLAKDADKALMQTKPWLAEGMSRASWYRRQKEKAK